MSEIRFGHFDPSEAIREYPVARPVRQEGDRLTTYRQAEAQAMEAEVGLNLPRPERLTEIVAPTLGNWLLNLRKAQESGPEIMEYSDPVTRRLGFIVEARKALHLIGLVRLKEAEDVTDELAKEFGHTRETLLAQLKTPESRQKLFSGVAPSENYGYSHETDLSLSAKELENLWADQIPADIPVDRGEIKLERPKPHVYDSNVRQIIVRAGDES